MSQLHQLWVPRFAILQSHGIVRSSLLCKAKKGQLVCLCQAAQEDGNLGHGSGQLLQQELLLLWRQSFARCICVLDEVCQGVWQSFRRPSLVEI